jgi:hypothetical protein
MSGSQLQYQTEFMANEQEYNEKTMAAAKLSESNTIIERRIRKKVADV